MFTSLLIVAIAGLITGFVLTIPVAGPVSIYITSQGLKGCVRYCTMTAIGAAVVDFIYCFAAVYGLTQLYRLYYPMIPYTLLIGGAAIVFIGIRIFRKSLPVNLNLSEPISEKIKHHNAFLTGFLLNFFNPTLFAGWLIASFAVLSFVASLGVNLGGIDHQLRDNLSVIQQYEDQIYHAGGAHSKQDSIRDSLIPPSNGGRYALMVSITFAFTLALGTVIWFYMYSVLLHRNRRWFQPKILNSIIQTLGLILSGFGVYIAIKALYYIYLTFSL